jgi:uncharacterized protein YbbC (DUF1343 family)
MSRMTVRNGVDNIDRYVSLLEGKKLGLITNPTGTDKSLRSTIDILNREFRLNALYSPEHGIRGCIQAGNKVENDVDQWTGLPVYSLYGQSKKPGAEILKDIDVLIFDIQDIGSRYYTFIYTMALSMKSCAEYGKTFVILDRVNPIGNTMEGNVLGSGFESFVGMYPIPVRHGMTVGELALLINTEFGIGANLEIVKIEGWKRDAYYDETDLFWINPTPNMPSADTALLYCGTCLFEGTNVSEGRGTTRPFEMIGAPWLNPYTLAEEMNRKSLDGVLFRPVYFQPVFSKHEGAICGGVQLHVKDRRKIRPFECGLQLLFQIRNMDRDRFSWLSPLKEGGRWFIDLLAGTDELRLTKPDSDDADKLLKKWSGQCEAFSEVKKKYLLYA